MSRQYDHYIHQQLEPTDIVITGNRKQYKEWPVYVDNRSEQSKRLDAMTLKELEEIEDAHLAKHTDR